MVIERQVFVTWYTPEEKMPPEDQIVIATISGKSETAIYDHTFALATWFDDGDGWFLNDLDLDAFEVHAWCDLEPYGGKQRLAEYTRGSKE